MSGNVWEWCNEDDGGGAVHQALSRRSSTDILMPLLNSVPGFAEQDRIEKAD